MELSGRSVFITGGAQGIGRAVTEALLAKGAKVNCPSGYVLHLLLCLSASGPVGLPVCRSVGLSVCRSVGLSVGLWASLCRPLGLCLSASGPVGLSVCRPLRLWASLSVGLCACGPLCLSASAPVGLSVCRPVGLSAFGPLGLFVFVAGRRRRDGRSLWGELIGVKCCLLSLMDTSEARMTASVFVCLDLPLMDTSEARMTASVFFFVCLDLPLMDTSEARMAASVFVFLCLRTRLKQGWLLACLSFCA